MYSNPKNKYQLWIKSDSQKENWGPGSKSKWRKNQLYFILTFSVANVTLLLKIGSFGGVVSINFGKIWTFQKNNVQILTKNIDLVLLTLTQQKYTNQPLQCHSLI